MECKRYAVTRDADFTTRAEDGRLYIEGYFAVYNSRYDLWEGAYETIAPGAFDGETEGDVRALTNHDTTLVLGRTTAGTLTLRLDDRGLWGSIEVNQADQDAMNTYERVKRRDVTQCSFGFDILDQEVTYKDGEPTVWTIRRVKLYEVSVVTFPAYQDTGVEARRQDFEALKTRRAEAWKAGALDKLRAAAGADTK